MQSTLREGKTALYLRKLRRLHRKGVFEWSLEKKKGGVCRGEGTTVGQTRQPERARSL